jgi:4-nitrophenyl phosphatase
VSSYSAAIYISRILCLPKNEKVFVLGESGIETELRSEGVSFIGGTDPNLRRDMLPSDYTQIVSGDALDPAVTVVLAGLDVHINYLKLSLAFHYLRRPGMRFLATNLDATLPHSHGLFPGAGSIPASLVNMMRSVHSDVEPLAMGKPNQAMMDAVEGRFKLQRSRTCMVGDRLNTDIRFGIEGGLGGTLGVLTGVMREEDLLQAGKEERGPSAYLEKVGDLLACD